MLATAFRKPELKTFTKKILIPPSTYDRSKVDELLRQSVKSARNSCLRSSSIEMPKNVPSVSCDSSLFEEDCIESMRSPQCQETNDTEHIEEKTHHSLKHLADVHHVYQANAFMEQQVDEAAFSDADSPYRYPMPGVSVQPPGITPWYANRVRLANIGVPHLTLGGTLLVPAKTSSDFWWNAIDSQTWLMGLQNYLFLHSLSDLGLCLQLSRPVPNLLTPSAVYGGGSSRVLTDPWLIPTNHHVQQPLSHFDRSRANAHFVPPAYSTCATRQGNLNISNGFMGNGMHPVCQPLSESSLKHETDSVSSSHGVIDLVNFMHNYCIPPSQMAASVPSVEYHNLAAVDQKQTVNSCVMAMHTASFDANRIPPSNRFGNMSTAENSLGFETESKRHFTPKLCIDMASSASHACRTDHSESDSDSAVVVTTGCSSAMSTSSPSSTQTENWFDDCSSSRSSPNIDSVCNSSTVLEPKTIELTNSAAFTSTSDTSPDSELTTPGWFGKGVGLRRTRKRRYRRESRDTH